MAVLFRLKSQAAKRLLSVIMICALLPNGAAWGLLQPPLSTATNPVFGTTGGKVPTAVPTNLFPYVKDVTAAIQLGKALFWDMQVGSDGVTACASCHYRAGADPVTAPVFDQITTHKRNKNQLHPGHPGNPGPDTIFGNNSTVIRTFDRLALTPVEVLLRGPGFPQFTPNYSLSTAVVDSNLNPLQFLRDFPLFQLFPPISRLVIDPLTGLATDAATSFRDTNDVVGSQGVRLADFKAIIKDSAADDGTPIADVLFHVSSTTPNTDPAKNVRQVTGRNAPSVINAVFNYTNFWDGRANNIFNGETPFGPLDQTAGIWKDNGTALEKQKIAIPNSSLASQAVGPALNGVEMSFKGRTFPELGRKMLSLTPLGLQHVHPNDSVLGAPLANAGKGLFTNYSTMIKAAFQDDLWSSGKSVKLPTVAKPDPVGEIFTQIEANFSLFWGLAIQLYEATLVSDQAPFDRFQAGNQNALNANEQLGFNKFDSKCIICHSGSEFSSAVVGSNNCPPTTLALVGECNRVAFTNNSTHNLIKHDFNPELGAPPAGLIDTGFFNVGVRPTADDPGRGGNAPFNNPLDIDPVTNNPKPFPLSFTLLALKANEVGLPFVTPKPPLSLPDKVQGSFKTPDLRNVELTAPYFHNGSALTLDQVLEFYGRGGNFPGNPELSADMQSLLKGDVTSRTNIVAFLKKLTDERVRNETGPFDHPQLMIPNGVDANGVDEMINLDATGGTDLPVPITTLTIIQPVSPTNLTTLVISGTVDDTATVAVDVTNMTSTPNISLPTQAATVGGTAGGVVGGVAQLPTDWSINLTGLTPGLNKITVTATSITGGTLLVTGAQAVVTRDIQITPTATISGTPLGGKTNQNFATLTIGGSGVTGYQYSLDGGTPVVVDSVSTPIVLTNLPDDIHTVAVLGRDVGGNQQPLANATTATWTVKANPPVLTLDAANYWTGSGTQTISGTIKDGSVSSVLVDTSATVTCAAPVPLPSGISTWSCEINGLAAGTNNVTVSAMDIVFNESKVGGVITRILPDGNFKGTGEVDITDALKAMRIAVKLVPATQLDLLHGDIAPLVDGKTTQDGVIDIADALLILRKTVGLVTF